MRTEFLVCDGCGIKENIAPSAYGVIEPNGWIFVTKPTSNALATEKVFTKEAKTFHSEKCLENFIRKEKQ